MRVSPKPSLIVIGVLLTAGSLAACSNSSTGATSTPSPAFLNASNVSLEGVWASSDRRFLTIDGVRGEGKETITISNLNQGLFDVSRALEVPATAKADLGTGDLTTTAVLDGVGAVNPDGTITILKQGDQGRITGWVIDDNTIEAVYSEGGSTPAKPAEPVVARFQLNRQATPASASSTP